MGRTGDGCEGLGIGGTEQIESIRAHAEHQASLWDKVMVPGQQEVLPLSGLSGCGYSPASLPCYM